MECIFDQKAGVNHQRNGESHVTDVLDVKRVMSCVVVPFAFCCETTLAGCTCIAYVLSVCCCGVS
jgi:Na+-transporting NADH:ubiquinone oxidoreductase subunit NqrB